jgi:hypothetical protein
MIHVVSVPFFAMPFDISRGDIKQVKIVMRVTIVTMASTKMNAATTTIDMQSSNKERTK